MRCGSTRLAATVVALCAASACGPAAAPAGSAWHVARGFIRDPDGRAVLLRGANIANMNKQAPYFDFHTAADFRKLHDDWGLDSVRFLIEWAAVEPSRGQYDGAYLDKVAERMQWASDANLLVVLDMHQDIYGEGFSAGGGDGFPRWTCDASHYAAFQPQSSWWMNYFDAQVIACFDAFWASDELQAAYAEAWRQVALRLAGSPAVVGFDIMNEPWGGSADVTTFEGDLLEPLYVRTTAAVRTAAPHWLAFFEPGWSRAALPTSLVAPPFADAVYAPHSYDADASHGLGFDASHVSLMQSYDASLAADAKALGAALWFGEYAGDPSKANVDLYIDTQFDAFGAAGGGSAWYDYGRDDSYGLLDPAGDEKPEDLALLNRPWPGRVAGDAVTWAWDPVTSTATMTWSPDASIAAKTQIAVPDACYPDGYTVDCGGCTWETHPGLLQINALASAGTATLVLEPK